MMNSLINSINHADGLTNFIRPTKQYIFDAKVIDGNILFIKDRGIYFDPGRAQWIETSRDRKIPLPNPPSTSHTFNYYVTFHLPIDGIYVMIITDSMGQVVCIREQADIPRQIEMIDKDKNFLQKICFILYHLFFDERFDLPVTKANPEEQYLRTYHQINTCLITCKSHKINHAVCARNKYLIVLDVDRYDDRLVRISLNDLVD
jgi:hypothetical protein